MTRRWRRGIAAPPQASRLGSLGWRASSARANHRPRGVRHLPRGITQKALAAGVSVCAAPVCRDQFDVDRHVEHADAELDLGAGRRLCMKHTSTSLVLATSDSICHCGPMSHLNTMRSGGS
jgi:hypothetical protein